MKDKNAIVGTKVTVKKSYGCPYKVGKVGTIVDFHTGRILTALVQFKVSTIPHLHNGHGCNKGGKEYPNSWYIGVKFLKLAEH